MANVDGTSVLNVVPMTTFESLELQSSCARCEDENSIPRSICRPRIVIDAIFYQYAMTGIARVWTCLLEEWIKSGVADHIVMLDRAGTCPRIAGIHYRSIQAHNYAQTGPDSLYLEKLCRELSADLFVSTYYSTPTDTPSVFMGYDMIPEVLGFDHMDEAWNEKRRAIEHASAHIMISANSARDLERIMPVVPKGSTVVARCGIAKSFRPASNDEIAAFKLRENLAKPYILMVGNRHEYKNGSLLFKSLSLLPDPTRFTVLCVGGHENVEEELGGLIRATDVRRVVLDDDELRAAYSGAHAYVRTSRYEGFGIPLIEAMVCRCPVISCRNSSIPEVAGDAALYLDDADDAVGLAQLLLRLEDHELRDEYVNRGVKRAQLFSFRQMGIEVSRCLLDAAEGIKSGTRRSAGTVWGELRALQVSVHELKSQMLNVDQLQSELMRSRLHVDQLIASSSWRITAPLRKLSQYLSRSALSL